MGLKDIDWEYFNSILESGTHEEFQEMLVKYDLSIKDGKIVANDKAEVNRLIEYWDSSQHIRKIGLNSLYGALLQPNCRFFDKRIGQSTTLTGRQIVKHMTAMTNEIVSGDYDYLGKSVIYNDTDSEVGTTVHMTNYGDKTIEELFENCIEFWNNGDKEYAYDPNLVVLTYDQEKNEPYFGHTNYIYRHKVSKDLYEIEDIHGNIITVTEDHSVMVERDNKLIEVKPYDILNTDLLISVRIVTKDLAV